MAGPVIKETNVGDSNAFLGRICNRPQPQGRGRAKLRDLYP